MRALLVWVDVHVRGLTQVLISLSVFVAVFGEHCWGCERHLGAVCVVQS
jgi:hypothetical protein